MKTLFKGLLWIEALVNTVILFWTIYQPAKHGWFWWGVGFAFITCFACGAITWTIVH